MISGLYSDVSIKKLLTNNEVDDILMRSLIEEAMKEIKEKC